MHGGGKCSVRILIFLIFFKICVFIIKPSGRMRAASSQTLFIQSKNHWFRRKNISASPVQTRPLSSYSKRRHCRAGLYLRNVSIPKWAADTLLALRACEVVGKQTRAENDTHGATARPVYGRLGLLLNQQGTESDSGEDKHRDGGLPWTTVDMCVQNIQLSRDARTRSSFSFFFFFWIFFSLRCMQFRVSITLSPCVCID